MDPMIIQPNQRVLFIDDWCVERSENVRRRIEPLCKHDANPLIVPELPWEGSQVLLYGTVHREPGTGRFRMWYFTGTGLGDTDFLSVAYAESEDGLRWRKPLMDIIRHDGKPTNLVIRRGEWKGNTFFYEPFTVIEDPGDPDPARRFKKVFFVTIEFGSPIAANPKIPKSRRGMGMAVSPDGLRWTPVNDWLTESIIDISQVMFDPARQQYVLYGRDHRTSPEIERAWGKQPWFKENYWGRCVLRMASNDTLRWSPPELVMASDPEDPPGSEVYTMSVFPYEGLYIGMIQRYINNPDDPERDGTLDYQYAVSHDGIAFEKLGDRTPCLPVGPVGAWDRFNQSIAYLPVAAGDEIRFYYSGRTDRHSPTPKRNKDTGPVWSGIGLATAKRDRFAGLDASFDGGTVETRPFILASDRIAVNVMAPAGALDVEVLDGAGHSLDGLTARVTGDSPDREVPLDPGRMRALAGKPVRLRFVLHNVRLYAFRMVADRVPVAALPAGVLPVASREGIDSNLQMRRRSGDGRTVFYLQNPAAWAVTAAVAVTGTAGHPVHIPGSGEVRAESGPAGTAAFSLDLGPFGSAGFCVETEGAAVAVTGLSVPPSVPEALRARIGAIKTAIQKAGLLATGDAARALDVLHRMEEQVDGGRYAGADAVWRDAWFQSFRDYALKLPREI